MTIAQHDIEAWVGTTKLGVIDASITMDESWAPYVQASIKVPLSQSILSKLDPRTGARIKLYISQKYGVSDKLSSLTATYTGKKISNVTTAWTGKKVSDLSAWYYVPYNASGSNVFATLSSLYGGQKLKDLTTAWGNLYFWELSEMYSRSYPSGIFNDFERSFDLTIRSRAVSVNDSSITLQLASDEALLQDHLLVSDINYSPATTDLRTIIKAVLARIGDSLVTGTTTATVPSAAIVWPPGQSAWDYLSPLLQAAKLRLYCDERRNWYLVNDTYAKDGLAELFGTETIVEASENISRDDKDWFDAVVIKYSWTNTAGTAVTAYDYASQPGFKKAALLEYTTEYPGPGAAQRILNRAIARGTSKDIRAVSNYAAEPSMPCNIFITGYPSESSLIRSVNWTFPADQMSVKTRQPVNN